MAIHGKPRSRERRRGPLLHVLLLQRPRPWPCLLLSPRVHRHFVAGGCTYDAGVLAGQADSAGRRRRGLRLGRKRRALECTFHGRHPRRTVGLAVPAMTCPTRERATEATTEGHHD